MEADRQAAREALAMRINPAPPEGPWDTPAFRAYKLRLDHPGATMGDLYRWYIRGEPF